MTLFVLLAAAVFYGFAWLVMILAGAMHNGWAPVYPNISFAEAALATLSVSFLISLYQGFKHDMEVIKLPSE